MGAARLAALALLVWTGSAAASTRFYFPADTAAQVAPVANGAWGYTSEALNRYLVMGTKSNTALADGTRIGPWTAGQTALDRRYVSDPLTAATLSGTVACVLMAREFATNDNTTSRFEIYVVHEDGQTVRGTALAIGQYGPATELLNTGIRNKRFADGDTITSVSMSDGDRIVVCIGYTDASGNTPEGLAHYGDPTSGTDLAENETNTTANPGWVEFSASLAKASTKTFTETATSTSTATATSTATVSGTHTATTTATSTATATATATSSSTDTVTATATATASVTATDTETATATQTASETATSTATATASATDTVTATETDTATSTTTATDTASETATATQTATATASATATATASSTATATETATETATATATATETVAGTDTVTHTFTVTATHTQTPLVTPTVTRRQGRIRWVR